MGSTIQVILKDHHREIIEVLVNLKKLCGQAKSHHAAYDSEFDVLYQVCDAMIETNTMIQPHTFPNLITFYQASLQSITTKVDAINSKPKSWEACETLGEHVRYIMHEVIGVMRSFLSVITLRAVDAENHHDHYFFHTPHHEKPEVSQFEDLLAELNGHIKEMIELLPNDDKTPAQSS